MQSLNQKSGIKITWPSDRTATGVFKLFLISVDDVISI